MQQIVKSIHAQLTCPAIMIEAYVTDCLGAQVFRPIQIVLGISFLANTEAREGRDTVAEMHALLDSAAPRGDLHDAALKDVGFLDSFFDEPKEPAAVVYDEAAVLEAAVAAAHQGACVGSKPPRCLRWFQRIS